MTTLLKQATQLKETPSSQRVETVLLVTVGGTPQPIVYAMLMYRPDYIVFLCSADKRSPMIRGTQEMVEGEGKVCPIRHGQPNELPNIRIQADMAHVPYDIVALDEIDNLKNCYRTMSQVFATVREHFPDARICADYTGGTKTMSAALAAAASDAGDCRLSVVSGDRGDLVRIEEGTHFLRSTDVKYIVVQRELERARQLMENYDFGALDKLASDLSKYDLENEQETRVRILTTLSRAFEAWDRFDHARALHLLRAYRPEFVNHVKFLEAVCSSRKAIDLEFDPSQVLRAEVGQGYEVVEDLILNAERRAHNRRYDDALGRLYRATEMLVQLHFKHTYGLSTSDLTLEQLPESARDHVNVNRQTGQRQTALRGSYELLEHFPDDPLWSVYGPRRTRLLNALSLRNQSLFAHGFRPISFSDYQAAAQEFVGLIEAGIHVLTKKTKRYALPVQLPTDFLSMVEVRQATVRKSKAQASTPIEQA